MDIVCMCWNTTQNPDDICNLYMLIQIKYFKKKRHAVWVFDLLACPTIYRCARCHNHISWFIKYVFFYFLFSISTQIYSYRYRYRYIVRYSMDWCLIFLYVHWIAPNSVVSETILCLPPSSLTPWPQLVVYMCMHI